MTRAPLERALYALENSIAIRNFEGGTIDGPTLETPTIEAIRAHLAKPETAPAWHDAPTEPGLWLSESTDGTYAAWNISKAVFGGSHWFNAGRRWFGPIPEDKP